MTNNVRYTIAIRLFAAMLAMPIHLPSAALAQQPVRRIAPERFPEQRLNDGRDGGHAARAAPTIDRPSVERPLGSCNRQDRQWLFCLSATAKLSDAVLEEAIDQVEHGFAGSEATSPMQRQSWSRALREADRRFRSLRDYECQTLSLSEPRASGELYETRLICLITRTVARADDLRRRYGLAN
ncbi:MAG: DUF1311 domain-containing protein [Rhizobiales bacterium]|nr:DUF1311 domain-containing protein [Hyphomicrobiales bacterium]